MRQPKKSNGNGDYNEKIFVCEFSKPLADSEHFKFCG